MHHLPYLTPAARSSAYIDCSQSCHVSPDVTIHVLLDPRSRQSPIHPQLSSIPVTFYMPKETSNSLRSEVAASMALQANRGRQLLTSTRVVSVKVKARTRSVPLFCIFDFRHVLTKPCLAPRLLYQPPLPLT